MGMPISQRITERIQRTPKQLFRGAQAIGIGNSSLVSRTLGVGGIATDRARRRSSTTAGCPQWVESCRLRLRRHLQPLLTAVQETRRFD